VIVKETGNLVVEAPTNTRDQVITGAAVFDVGLEL
jgi:hypothetical protein